MIYYFTTLSVESVAEPVYLAERLIESRVRSIPVEFMIIALSTLYFVKTI